MLRLLCACALSLLASQRALAGSVDLPKAPEWTSSDRSLRTGDALFGVGAASGIRNREAALRAAVNRGRREIQKRLTDKNFCEPPKGYLQATVDESAALRAPCERMAWKDGFHDEALRDAAAQGRLAESWRDPADGTVFALVRLDSATAVAADKVKEASKSYLPPGSTLSADKSCWSFLPPLESGQESRWLAYLDRFGDVNAVCAEDGLSALGFTIEMTQEPELLPRRVAAMLAKGADVNATASHDDGFSPLHYAIAFQRDEALIKLLITHGAKVNVTSDGGMTPLMSAVLSGKLELVELLLAAGAHVNDRSADQETALMLAAEKGLTDMLRLLLAKDADVLAKNADGLRALELAEKASQPDAARLLRKAMGPSPADETRGDPKSEVDTPAYRSAPDPTKFAVVAGVENYRGGLPAAQYAERDARSMREHLIALGYPQRNIVLLTNQEASRAGIAKNVETWLPRLVDERSTVLFYFSGHGAPDPTSGRAFLVPSDGDPQYLDDTAYPVARLYEKLGALKAKRVIVVLDSCFSGAGGRSVLARGLRPLVTKVQLGGFGKKVVSLTASAADQVSGTDEEQGHGLFTYYLLKGLNGAAADAAGRVTVRGLFDYLSPQVSEAARRSNRDQVPQLSNGGDESVGLR